MPVYEYECVKCHQTTELLRKMSEADAAATCEHCGSQQTQRVQSVFAANTTGGGGSGGGGSEMPVCPTTGRSCGCAGGCAGH